MEDILGIELIDEIGTYLGFKMWNNRDMNRVYWCSGMRGVSQMEKAKKNM